MTAPKQGYCTCNPSNKDGPTAHSMTCPMREILRLRGALKEIAGQHDNYGCGDIAPRVLASRSRSGEDRG